VFFLDSNIQQYKGVEWHRMMQKIPKGNYRKAILKIDLGCATYGCCAWDYTYRGFFSKKINDTSFEDIEIARLITPYSSFMRKGRYGYDSTWVHPYQYDVTDFMPLIKDSVIFSAHTGGWDDKGKFGFKHTVTLYLIKGDNAQVASNLIPMYKNAYRYHDSSQFDHLIAPFHFKIDKEDKFAKFRVIFTGHDQQGEFSPIPFYVKLNGKQIFQKRLWKTDCDQNAIQPQSGTWIFSRCNWCPGEKVQEIEVDLSPFLKQGDNEIDLLLGKIETQDSQINANYLIDGNVILYKSRVLRDIELVSIVAPNTDPNFRIYNPICQTPKLKIRNKGSDIANYVTMNCWIDNNPSYEYTWTGSLATNEEVIIDAGQLEMKNSKPNSIFHAALKSTMYNTEKYNDTLISHFKMTDVFHTNSLIFEIATTNDSSINQLKLFLKEEDVDYFQKDYFNNNSVYRDIARVVDGCYQLILKDYDKNYECGDGLSFWYSSRIGKKTSGIFKIYDAKSGKLLKVFNPDFGGKIDYQFRIENK